MVVCGCGMKFKSQREWAEHFYIARPSLPSRPPKGREQVFRQLVLERAEFDVTHVLWRSGNGTVRG
jgi:hypothetical protein